MKRSLMGKLILSYLAVALLTVLVVIVVIRLTSNQSLMSLVVEQQTALLNESAQTYYTTNGTMEGFFDFYAKASQPEPAPDKPAGPNKPPRMRGLQGLVDTSYRALIPTFGYEIGQIVPAELVKKAIEVKVDGQIIAWILPDTGFQFKLSSEEQLFLQRTTLALGLSAVAGVLAAVAMGSLLAGKLLKPIRRLTRASEALAQGELRQQVPVTSRDELGQLTTTFNQMSAELELVDQQRKRLTADITHDLGTPLQVISGYMEMLEEGEVSLTAQRIEIIKTEIDHLRRLVNDLSTLSQVEAGGLEMQLQVVQVSELMERVFYAYQPITTRQGVEMRLEAIESTPSILVDEGRMEQVMKNLVENALRYTPKGGLITLSVTAGERIHLRVRDNGSGIDAEDLPYVFDRFYSADKARGANSGKMGLGLAICKALVTAQGGNISAVSDGKGKGTTMIISLPPAPA